jgi:hypothetical protein
MVGIPHFEASTQGATLARNYGEITYKLRCAAEANQTTHNVTHGIAMLTRFCPTLRRHLQRLVLPAANVPNSAKS